MAGKKILLVTFYGLAMALLAGIMTWAKFRFLILDQSTELYGLVIGIVFVVLGIWMGLKLSRPKTIVKLETIVQKETVIKEVPVTTYSKTAPDPVRIAEWNISQRELEVLHFLAQGLSNDEIAGKMFVSQNTVKTHLSNIYFKLEVKRRTQAVEKARGLGLI